MEKKFKIGDLVSCDGYYVNGRSVDYYAKVISLIKYNKEKQVSDLLNGLTTNDNMLEHIDKCDIITGYGDKNTKVIIKVNIFAEHQGSHFESLDKIKMINEEVKYYNPHDVRIVSLEEVMEDYKYRVKVMDEKVKFVKKWMNRLDKIDIALEK